MADSTEDLRREMEEFERNEADPQSEAEALESLKAPAPARKVIPTWVYGMIAIDIVIFIAVIFYFVV